MRVPRVSDPTHWTTSLVSLTSAKVVIRDAGWTVTFIKVSSGPETPIITPHLAPAFSVIHTDKALAAYVILPESGAMNQYWVPVTERLRLGGKCFAQLNTAEWTVIFLRDPL